MSFKTNIIKVKARQGQILSLLSSPTGLVLLFLSFMKWRHFYFLTLLSLEQTLQTSPTASRLKLSSSLTASFKLLASLAQLLLGSYLLFLWSLETSQSRLNGRMGSSHESGYMNTWQSKTEYYIRKAVANIWWRVFYSFLVPRNI